MLRALVIRLLIVATTFLGVTTVAFALIHLIPGDPITLIAGERGVSEERHAALMAQYGFDQPLSLQYIRYVGDVLQGDLGTSIKSKRPVLSEFLALFPATIELSFFAMLIAVVIGIPVGVLAFQLGVGGASVDPASSGTLIPRALAFSAGTFLCVSLSDLLPELQFHQHDRFKLSAALLLGLGLAFLLGHPM